MTLITDLTPDPVAPGTTPAYEAQLVDQAGNAIPAAALTSLTLTIADTTTGQIINGCEDVNILNANRGIISAQGSLIVSLLAGDTALLDRTHLTESRSLVLMWSYNSGTYRNAHQVNFMIQKLVYP